MNTLPSTEKHPATREEAIALGLTFYYTGKPCKHGHISKRRASNQTCCDCNKGHSRNYMRRVLASHQAIKTITVALAPLEKPASGVRPQAASVKKAIKPYRVAIMITQGNA